jgi:hypothetical protein
MAVSVSIPWFCCYSCGSLQAKSSVYTAARPAARLLLRRLQIITALHAHCSSSSSRTLSQRAGQAGDHKNHNVASPCPHPVARSPERRRDVKPVRRYPKQSIVVDRPIRRKDRTCIKDVQKLTGCMAALNRFISNLGERGLPFFKLLKNQEKFV